MSSFEWIELESLSLEISNAEARLAEASSRDFLHLVTDIETQIANAKARREHILESISRNTASIAITPDEHPEPNASVSDQTDRLPLTEDDRTQLNTQQNEDNFVGPHPVDAEPIGLGVAASDPSGSENDLPSMTAAVPAEEAAAIWDRLPAVLERARLDIERRRAEILARQAEELKALDDEHLEIEALERALEAFARRFGRRPESGQIVRLDEERGLRMQHAGN